MIGHDTISKQSNTPVSFVSHGWRGLITPEWQELITDHNPSEFTYASKYHVLKTRPASRIIRVETRIGEVYVKHTISPKDNPNLLARLKWIARSSQAISTYNITNQMIRSGIMAPRVVLAARKRYGLHAEDLLITETVPGPTLKAALRSNPSRNQVRHLIHLAARHVAAMHRAGFIHGDLLAGNMMVTPDQQSIVFIDNDRTRSTKWCSKVAKRRNLEQITQRIRRHGMWTVRLFLRSYCQELGISADVQSQMERYIIPRASQRWRVHRRTKQSLPAN